MRFAARFLNYKHGVRTGRHMVLADGQRQELVRDLMAVFKPAKNILTPAELEQAITSMTHRGLPIDRNTETLFSPKHRISGFDSVEAQQENEWTDEERELVEQTLLTSLHYGSDHIRLDEPAVEKPWSTYDDTPGEKVIPLATGIGVSLADVLAYERANRNDAGLVYLLERAIEEAAGEPSEDAPVVIEA